LDFAALKYVSDGTHDVAISWYPRQ